MKYDPLNEKTTVIVGDALEKLRELESESVHCCVTSPPYFGLRDYGTAEWRGGNPECDHKQGRNGSGRADGIVDDRAQRNRDGVGAMGVNCKKCGAIRVDKQIGLEETPDQYVAKMVEIFREVRRVLRDDGTLWLNLGDSYAATTKGSSGKGKNATNKGTHIDDRSWQVPNGLKPKDLIGIPWRVAFALQADGWYLRQDIIWHKPNPMPESVKDRCTKAHEYVFMFSKSAKYFYDADAIAEPVSEALALRLNQASFDTQTGGPKDYANGTNPNRSARKIIENLKEKQITRGEKYGAAKGVNGKGADRDGNFGSDETRNRRSVWTIATQPYAEAHFATMAPQLATDCIKAGSPAGGVILDPFGGAGTTALCATLLGRSAILIELNPEYEKLIRKRLKIGKTEIAAPVQDAGIFEGLL